MLGNLIGGFIVKNTKKLKYIEAEINLGIVKFKWGERIVIE